MTDDGEAFPLECNPRAHSLCCVYAANAVTMASFGDALASLGGDQSVVEPVLGSQHYWFYNELFKVLPGDWIFKQGEGDVAKSGELQNIVRSFCYVTKDSGVLILSECVLGSVIGTTQIYLVRMLEELRHMYCNFKIK